MKKDLIKVQKAYDEKVKIKELETKLMQQKQILSDIEGNKKIEKENKGLKSLSPDEMNDLLVSQSSNSFSLYPNGMYRSLKPSNGKTFSDEYHIEDDQLVFEQEVYKKTDIQGVLNNLCTKYYIL